MLRVFKSFVEALAALLSVLFALAILPIVVAMSTAVLAVAIVRTAYAVYFGARK
jgi:type III secretory pathway component EscR